MGSNALEYYKSKASPFNMANGLLKAIESVIK